MSTEAWENKSEQVEMCAKVQKVVFFACEVSKMIGFDQIRWVSNQSIHLL